MPLNITVAQSIIKMHQYGNAFFEKYQFNILSNRFLIQYITYSSRLQNYTLFPNCARKTQLFPSIRGKYPIQYLNELSALTTALASSVEIA